MIFATSAARCSTIKSELAGGLCVRFIDGYRQPPSANLKLLCPPDGVSNGQLVKVFVKYLDQHPEKLHLPAVQLVYDATNDAFPCAPAGTE
jgi:hypothetical protein